MVRLTVKVVGVEPGRIAGQHIATAVSDNGVTVVFDVIENLINIAPRDVLEITITENKPSNMDDYEFCGHGYLVTPEPKFNETIFSIWGVIFKFKPPINLELDKKYYLCMKHLTTTSKRRGKTTNKTRVAYHRPKKDRI